MSQEANYNAKSQQHLEEVYRAIEEAWIIREQKDNLLHSLIPRAAEILEDKYIRTNQPEKVETICSEIFNRFKDDKWKGLKARIAEILPSKYKRSYNVRTVLSEYYIEECSVKAEQLIEKLKKVEECIRGDPYSVDRSGVQSIALLAKTIKDKVEYFADKNKIQLPYERGSLGDENKEKEEEEPGPLPTDKLVLRLRQILHDKLIELGKCNIELAESVIEKNYIADDPNILQEYILGVQSLLELARPVTDRKWGLDLLQWCDVLENFYDQGGTYASSKSAVDVADMINPKTGKPIVRKITKEQIDAVHPKLLNNMRFIVTNFKYVLAMYKNFRAKERGYRAKRRVKLHDVLSEAA